MSRALCLRPPRPREGFRRASTVARPSSRSYELISPVSLLRPSLSPQPLALACGGRKLTCLALGNRPWLSLPRHKAKVDRILGV